MGAALFECRDLVVRYDVIALSSNFSLYGDLSERVLATLEEFGLPVEIYSIDEAFIDLPEDVSIVHAMSARVLQWTGIPISIGIGATKTLAKLASELAKKQESGVFAIDTVDPSTPIQHVWGIGGQTADRLRGYGIRTVGDLLHRDDTWIQKQFSITLLRTAMELRGISCLPFDEIEPPKKGIVTSRTFGQKISQLSELKEAVAAFASRASEKLRSQRSIAAHLGVFLMDQDRFTRSAFCNLATPTSYTPHLIEKAFLLLAELYQEGQKYKKAGVMLNDITAEDAVQLNLFASTPRSGVMHLVDTINQKSGKRALFFAAEGVTNSWKPIPERKSANFTTDWDELLTIQL